MRDADAIPGRHCWVIGHPGTPGRWRGLLVQWRRDGRAWRGHVILVVPGHPGPQVLMTWVDAEHLHPG